MLYDRTFGIHLHAFYDGSELVVGLNPVRVIQGEVPSWVEAWVLNWVRQHEAEFQTPREDGDVCVMPRTFSAALHS